MPIIDLLATGQKHMPVRFSLTTNAQSMPSFNMHRGQPIGCRVVDDDGRPVAGAVITISAPYNDDSGKFVVAKWPTVITDTNGVWSLACASPGFTSLILSIQCSKILPAVIYEQDDTSGVAFSFRG